MIFYPSMLEMLSTLEWSGDWWACDSHQFGVPSQDQRRGCHPGDGHPSDGGNGANEATFHRNQNYREPERELHDDQYEGSGRVRKDGGISTGSSQACTGGLSTKTSLRTSRGPRPGGSGTSLNGPGHHKSNNQLDGKWRASWRRTEWCPEDSGGRTWHPRQWFWRRPGWWQ